jgi:hypothetical protein
MGTPPQRDIRHHPASGIRHHAGCETAASQEGAVDIGKPRRVITVEPEREPVAVPVHEPDEEPVPATPTDHRAGAED